MDNQYMRIWCRISRMIRKSEDLPGTGPRFCFEKEQGLYGSLTAEKRDILGSMLFFGLGIFDVAKMIILYFKRDYLVAFFAF